MVYEGVVKTPMIVCKGPKSGVDLQVIQLHLSVSLNNCEDKKNNFCHVFCFFIGFWTLLSFYFLYFFPFSFH